MAQWIPIVSVLITVLSGVITYLFQKIRDRREELIKTRRLEYRRWLQVLYEALASRTEDDKKNFNKATNELFLFGSDDVIRAVGTFKTYMSELRTSDDDVNVAGRLLVEVVIAMRSDCFERTQLSKDDIQKLLPLTSL